MRLHRLIPIATACVAAFLPAPARADAASATGQGITGCALLGGEVVLIGEAIAGVRPSWAYWLGGTVGMVGGGVGGYFLEQGGDARLAMYLMTGGTALIIPTAIVVLNATSFREPDDFKKDDQGAVGSAPRTASAGRPLKRSRVQQPMNSALASWREGALSWSLPALAITPVFSPEEQAAWGLRQAVSLRMPVFGMAF